ncbi:MAG: DinB family protein [Actinobacteria bacterium]|nr:DinB family protein [Actinomycetota bacterium]
MRCEECGFDWDGEPIGIGTFADRFAKPLTRFLKNEDANVVLRARPEPAVWSALEYVAHTRDALAFYVDRIRRVLTEDRPRMTKVDFDDLCVDRGYNSADPAQTAAELGAVERELVDQLADLTPAQWARVGIGSDGDERTVLALARRAAHEGNHHLLDVGRVLRRVRQTLER